MAVTQFCVFFAPKTTQTLNMERYLRNRIYVNNSELDEVRRTRIFLGGAGIGSIIAECALRFGFERITIVDGDRIELSNLNRQNYTTADVGKFKAETLANRLLAINPDADIKVHNVFITCDNVDELLADCDIAVNALDFKDMTPFVFDDICAQKNIPVLHPYNFGWAGFLAAVEPRGAKLSLLSDNPQGFDLKVAKYVADNTPCKWFEETIRQVAEEEGELPPPQLSIGSWAAASLAVKVMYRIATGKNVDYFPKYYLSGF